MNFELLPGVSSQTPWCTVEKMIQYNTNIYVRSNLWRVVAQKSIYHWIVPLLHLESRMDPGVLYKNDIVYWSTFFLLSPYKLQCVLCGKSPLKNSKDISMVYANHMKDIYALFSSLLWWIDGIGAMPFCAEQIMADLPSVLQEIIIAQSRNSIWEDVPIESRTVFRIRSICEEIRRGTKRCKYAPVESSLYPSIYPLIPYLYMGNRNLLHDTWLYILYPCIHKRKYRIGEVYAIYRQTHSFEVLPSRFPFWFPTRSPAYTLAFQIGRASIEHMYV